MRATRSQPLPAAAILRPPLAHLAQVVLHLTKPAARSFIKHIWPVRSLDLPCNAVATYTCVSLASSQGSLSI